MKQKTIFILLVISISILTSLFFWNNINKKTVLKLLENDISKIDYELSKNKNIVDDIIQIENDLFIKRDTLISKLSYGENILSEIEAIKKLAKEYKIELKDIEIDNENTFPLLYQYESNEQLPLERQTLSFQLSGRFISIGKFLESQNNIFQNIFLNQCVFNTDSLDPLGVIAHLEYNIYGDVK